MQHVDEKNHHHYIPDNMVKMVSSRRGSNFLLHNLGENDVVFGTKGNGRNEVFLKVLERNSEQYIHLSKFQKMGLIQQIIREWKGNFYILNSKTNDLCLAKKNDHELSTTDPSARKLYTSVRRMMNYVNSKNQRQHQQQPQQQQQREISTTTVPTTPVPSRTTSTSTNIIPQVRKERIKKENNKNKNKKRKTVSATSTNQGPTQTKHGIMMNNTTAYINHDHHSILPRSDIGFPYSSASTTNDSMIIAAPQRSSTMVTPEPSPRTVFSFLPPPPPPPTSSISQVAISVTHPSISIPSSQDTTSVLTPSSSSLPPSSLSATTQEENRNHQHSAKETANNVVTAKYRNSNNSTADNIIGHMEESAILALAYLASTAF